MPQEIADRLAELPTMSDGDIAKLQKDIVKEFDKLDKKPNKTNDDVDAMEALAGAVDAVQAEQTSRTEASAAAEERAQALRDKMHPADGDGEPAEVLDPEASAEGEEGEGEEGEPESQPLAAGGKPKGAPAKLPTIAELNAAKPNGGSGPTLLRASTRTITQFQAKGLKLGEKITSRAKLDELMTEKVDQLTRAKGTGEKFLVASVYTDYPAERVLGQDIGENDRKIRAVVDQEAIVASGGVCGPVAVDYDILILSSTDEPLGDSLPKFNADRGGVRYIQPPSFVSVGSSATGIWTNATDTTPGGATKPIQTIACGNVVETYVDAIPTRLKFGNMGARYFPELIAANTDLALANAARVKELNRLTKISANSTLVSSAQLLGASRDILATLDLVVAAMRYRSRLSRATPIRTIFPDWAKDLFRADLTREIGHQQGGDWNSLSLTDAQVNSLLGDRGINVTWMLDGQAAVTAAPAWALQGWGAQAAGTLLDWPKALTWWAFPEGTFQLIDGGRMDFGVIRDSTLDATNDYETMIEVFENVIYRGFESLEVVSNIRPNGESAAAASTASY